MIQNWIKIIVLGVISTTVASFSISDCPRENFVFQNGEIMKYKLYYNWKSVWIGAGEATFSVEPSLIDGKSYHHVVAEGKTFRTFNWFYKVHDRYESYLDTKTLYPKKFIRDVYEGGYEFNHVYNFDYDQAKIFADLKNHKRPFRQDTFNISGCTHDILSAVYSTRCIDFGSMAIGDTVPVRIFLDNKYYGLHLRYLGKEIIQTKLGNFRCIKVSPLLIKGRIFDDETDMVIYITDDDNRIPILAESPIVVGSVKALLVGFEGIRNPLTSKVN